MKFDYRGIVQKIKTTLEQTYKRANCFNDFAVIMLVVDVRVGHMHRAEYSLNDIVKVVSSDKKLVINADAMLEKFYHKLTEEEMLPVKDLYKVFKNYCQDCGNSYFSDVYPIYEAKDFKFDALPDASVSTREVNDHLADESFLKGIIAVCNKQDTVRCDDFLIGSIPCFTNTFYELITREYIRQFSSGVVNSVFSQSVSLPVNIISNAGVKYMNFWGKSLSATNAYGRYDDFVTNINKISELAYEKNEAFGRIIFCDTEFPDEFTIIKFKTPYKLSGHKLIRKLLQIVDKGHCLAATSDNIYGIISEEQLLEFSQQRDVVFAINFKRERIWSISYLGRLRQIPVTVFESEYEGYKYSSQKLDYYEIGKIFDNFTKDSNCDVIFNIITSAMSQSHGTMLVFSKEAESETERLKNTCIPLKKPINLGDDDNHDLVSFITSIDGAVLCDETGLCYAIGVILDGFASADDDSFEDISRGARHNSAYRYLRGNKGKCVIIVVSEDGDVSIIA